MPSAADSAARRGFQFYGGILPARLQPILEALVDSTSRLPVAGGERLGLMPDHLSRLMEMTKTDRSSEYDRRMHRVLQHIESHLDEPLDLERLAAVAHFSPFHFHRLCSAWLGETLGDYLRRRRLESAAMRLRAQPRLGILQVALSVGFGSGEAFTRAFKARFGVAPGVWRRQQIRKSDQASLAEIANTGRVPRPIRTAMNVQLRDCSPEPIVYLRHQGPYGLSIQRFWMERVVPWMMSNDLGGRSRYGISHDDPGITASESLRYDAAVTANISGPPLRGGGFHSSLPGGRYAVMPFRGTNSEIVPAWADLLGVWLPSSGFQLDSRPLFEHYPPTAGLDQKTGVFDCEICIPVAPL